MPFILLTSLISPNFHHIPQEKINPLLYFFAELHSLYSMFQTTTKILSLHDNVLKCTSSAQIATWDTIAYSANSKVYLSSTDTLAFRKINWHNVFSHPSHCAVYSHYSQGQIKFLTSSIHMD